MKFDEVFQGYCMDANGSYAEPMIINTTDDLGKFILENVEKHHELRVTDTGDSLVFHVVNQVLLFPIPPGGTIENHWDSSVKKFVDN